ncbi:hypothetical protein RKD19_000111 [Streptomyces canus]
MVYIWSAGFRQYPGVGLVVDVDALAHEPTKHSSLLLPMRWSINRPDPHCRGLLPGAGRAGGREAVHAAAPGPGQVIEGRDRQYAWSGRERLGLLRLREDAIVLHAMRWPDEVRDPAAVDPPNETLSQEELDGALALVGRMSRDDLEGPEFADTYTDALAKIIESKREDKPLPDVPEPEQPGKVLDLMAALNESVQQAKASRGEDADVHEMPKRRTAKKQPAKKTAAKKTTKKTAARRPRSA